MKLRSPLAATAAFALSLFLACGGGDAGHAPVAVPAAALTYADPGSTGWRLVKDPSSTPTRLVLNLVGPAGTLSRGVGFNLQAPSDLAFQPFEDGRLVQDAGRYELLSAAADPAEPVAALAGVKAGNLLSVGIYQKGRETPAKDSGAPLCRIALSLRQGHKRLAGERLELTVPKARIIPEDIGTAADSLHTLNQKLRMAPITVAVGTLSTR